jgi:POT family proton-dependent oligopeptide transporter
MDNSPGTKDAIQNTPSAPTAAALPGTGDDLASRLSLPQSSGIVGWFKSHPVGFWFFFWGEFAERASYYGMRAILTLYMIDKLGFSKSDASTIMSVFIAGCYFLPLVGGFVADRFLGKYWTIVGFSIPYILGHVILGIESPMFMYIALVLLAMGTGVIKPNISTLMGNTYDLYRPGQTKLRSEAFAMFYFAINVGAFLSQLAMPEIRTRISYSIAFMFPAALMVIAFAIFAAGKRYYAVDTPGEYPQKTPEERRLQWTILGRLFLLFLLITFFWAIFDQSASTWIYFARESLDLHLFGMPVDPDQVQALNPLFIMIFLPLITLLWRYVNVRATDKILIGFILTGLTMAIHAVAAQLAITSGAKQSLWWQVIAFLVLTWAEILISVTGLELAFTAAPKSMKSFITACWLLTVGLANLVINVPFTRLYPGAEEGSNIAWLAWLLNPLDDLLALTLGRIISNSAHYFAVLTVLMVVVSATFVFVARRFNRGLAEWQEDPAAKPELAPAVTGPSDAIQEGPSPQIRQGNNP